jgi:hypothetical protein
MLWHVDLLLGNDHEISCYTMAITMQQQRNSVFCVVRAEML